jgi:hypothetical protein
MNTFVAPISSRTARAVRRTPDVVRSSLITRTVRVQVLSLRA